MGNKSKRAVLVMEEAAGKRIRQFALSEPYPKSHEIYLTVEFDDETEILIEVGCVPTFGITHLTRDGNGELKPMSRCAAQFECLRNPRKYKKDNF